MINLVLLRSTIATLVAWAGGALGAVVGGAAKRHLNYLVTAALGALLAVTIFDILPDSLQLISIIPFIVAASSGAALFWVVGRYIYPVCPACSPGDISSSNEQLTRTVVLIAVALGLHSTMDGAAVVIGDTLAHGANAAVFFAVSLHKFPEGMALVLLLIGAGLRRWNALLYTIGIESMTELGALGALFLVTKLPPVVLGFIFANIGGGFLYLVVSTIILERHKAQLDGGIKQVKVAAIGGLAGFAITCAILLVSQAATS
jgi:zinc transporter ZupT